MLAQFKLFFVGLHGTRQEEMIDHRLTDREWAEEWKHLDHVRCQFSFGLRNSLQICNVRVYGF